MKQDSTKKAVVDPGYNWLPMSNCPVDVKVQLLNAGGVAVYSLYNGKPGFWRGWAPLPTIKK